MRALKPLPRRPTFWVEMGLAVGWAVLIFASLQPAQSGAASGSSWAGGSLWICVTDVAGAGSGMAGHAPGLISAGPSTPLLTTLPMLALMAMAMMLPPALPTVQRVALNSLYWRRRRAALEFVAVFLAVWMAYSLTVLGALDLAGLAAAPLAPAAALALAALWQLTPTKRRALQACHRTRPLPPRGWRATAAVAGFGLRNGLACLASCWAMMLTMAFAGPPRLAWMAALTGLITAERLSVRPRRACARVGAVLAAAALVSAALALA